MKKIIYTCITDGYDNVVEQPKFKGWEYKLFETTGGVRTAREYKIRPYEHFDYDVCLWVDGNIEINCDVDQFLDYEFLTMQHPDRMCIYDEANTCKDCHKDTPSVIDKQMKRYRADGMPEYAGLVATGVLFRQNTDSNKRFCDAWWHELEMGSFRDQLSLNYVAWKQKKEYNIINFMDGFKLYGHR